MRGACQAIATSAAVASSERFQRGNRREPPGGTNRREKPHRERPEACNPMIDTVAHHATKSRDQVVFEPGSQTLLDAE